MLFMSVVFTGNMIQDSVITDPYPSKSLTIVHQLIGDCIYNYMFYILNSNNA